MLSQPTTLPTDRSGGMAGGFVVGWELSVPASSPAPREEKVPPIVRGAFLSRGDGTPVGNMQSLFVHAHNCLPVSHGRDHDHMHTFMHVSVLLIA